MGDFMSSNQDNVWLPIEYKDGEPDAFTDRLIKWMSNPSSEPEIEKWYKYGKSKVYPSTNNPNRPNQGFSFNLKKNIRLESRGYIMYHTSYLEDYIEKLYRNLGIRHPDQLDKYSIGNKLNIGIYLVGGESEAFCSNERNYIFLNRNLNLMERWQDFGHELCHVLRHSGHQGKIPPMFRELQEWQADNFMYHFCVPTFMLQRIRFPPEKQRAISLIAETFQVEYKFAERRLERYYQKVSIGES